MKTGMFGKDLKKSLKKHGKKLTAVLVALTLAMSGVMVSPLEPEVAKADTVIHYMNPTVNPTTHEVTFSDATIDMYTVVTSPTNTNPITWNGGWYAVTSDVTIGSRITVSGTVNLILCNGASLNAGLGVTVSEGNTLNIFGQSEGTGELIATCVNSTEAAMEGYAAIGGNTTQDRGTITINGGKVTSTGGNNGAGIGGGYSGSGSGGGDSGSGGNITINGGTVTANGGSNAAGIGGGSERPGGTITINGGTVTSTGGNNGAGIGGGDRKTGTGITGSIDINGGTVTATGGSQAAGIGGGYYGDGTSQNGSIKISGGHVEAYGGVTGAGIGGGNDKAGGTILITGGEVIAKSKASNVDGIEQAAGIGGGLNGDGGTVTISGGAVTASGGSLAEGIGKGEGTVNVSGTLNYGPNVKLFGGDSADPTEMLADAASTAQTYSGDRKRYMKAIVANPPSGGGESSYIPYDPPAPEPKFPGGEGWTGIVKEIGNITEGGKLEINMNGTITLPTSAINAIQGKDVTFVLDMGNGIKWTINGKDVGGASGDVYLGVYLGATGIPTDVINNLTGEREKMNLMLSRDGGLGFMATLTLPLKKEWSGLTANLFNYNKGTKEMDFVSSGKINADGTTDLTIGGKTTATKSSLKMAPLLKAASADQASAYYTIIIDDHSLDPNIKPEQTDPETPTEKTYNLKLKGTSKKGKVTLSWKKLKKAKKYRIYQKVGKKFKLVKELKKNKLTLKKALTKKDKKVAFNVGSKYTFKVTAYIDKSWKKKTKNAVVIVKIKK